MYSCIFFLSINILPWESHFVFLSSITRTFGHHMLITISVKEGRKGGRREEEEKREGRNNRKEGRKEIRGEERKEIVLF